MFTDAKDVREFVLAGCATVTLESERTGAHFTYRVRQAKDRETEKPAQRWFVSLLSGPNNESDYVYLGLIDFGARSANFLAPTGPLQFRQTAKAKVGPDAPSVRGFTYFWKAITEGKMPCSMVVRHEGKCGRCGRTLTVPESLDRGIGPECAGKMGMAATAPREQARPVSGINAAVFRASFARAFKEAAA